VILKTLLRPLFIWPHAAVWCVIILGLFALVKGQRPKQPVNTTSGQELILTATDEPEKPTEYHVDFLKLAPDRLLVEVDDMLYLLDQHRRVIWKTSIDFMIDMPVADSNGKLFGIRVDHGLFSIDPSTGQVDYFGIGPRSGRGSYTQITPYKDGQYLVVTSWEGYRENASPYDERINDHLAACKGKEQVWDAEIPPHARIEVWGEKIFTFTKRKEGVAMQEVVVPRRAP
jgi:hypothetical protein